MHFEIREESVSSLGAVARLAISFLVESQLTIEAVDGGLRGITLRESVVADPYVKDYDALPGANLMESTAAWDTSNWGLISAFYEERRIGGAVIAYATPNLDMLEGRGDLAVLWDLRLDPEFRRMGAGKALFAASEVWARERGCRLLKVETQNINVPACRFYAAQGCVLGSINRFAYPDHPQETQLNWYKALGGLSGASNADTSPPNPPLPDSLTSFGERGGL